MSQMMELMLQVIEPLASDHPHLALMAKMMSTMTANLTKLQALFTALWTQSTSGDHPPSTPFLQTPAEEMFPKLPKTQAPSAPPPKAPDQPSWKAIAMAKRTKRLATEADLAKARKAQQHPERTVCLRITTVATPGITVAALGRRLETWLSSKVPC